MQVKITTSSKFGNSIETVELKDVDAKHVLVASLKKLHARDNATVTFSNIKKGYFEQVV